MKTQTTAGVEVKHRNGTIYTFAKKASKTLTALFNQIADIDTRDWIISIKANIAQYGDNGLSYKNKPVFEIESDGSLRALNTTNDYTSLLEYNTKAKAKIGGRTETGIAIVVNKADGSFACTGGFCFPAGTPITVKQNNQKALKNIENIVAGDVVGGYDHTLKKFAWGVVKATKKSIKRGLVSLFAAGTLIAQPTLEHPVWTENHHDYVAAQDLKVGDIFLDGKGATLRLDSLAIKPDTTLTVYNFEVNDLHNYYVGTQEVLVHNDCVTLADIERKGISKEKITAFENALKDAKITPAERTKFYQQVLSDLNTNKLTTADADRLMSEFASPNLNSKTKKFLANFTDKGSLDVWIATKSWGNRLDVLDQMANIKINTSKLTPVYNFSKTTDGFEVWQGLQPGGINWATIKEKKVTALPGGTKGRLLNDFNQVLNVYPLMKRMEYEVDERFVYKTDANGNVSEMTDKNVEYFDKHERTERNEQEQTKNSKKKGAKTGDAGGHIASNESNGPSEQINYWPMNSPSNSGGAWRNMENYIRVNLKGADPTATFKVVYEGTSWTNGRPGEIAVSVFKTKNGITTRLNINPHNKISNP